MTVIRRLLTTVDKAVQDGINANLTSRMLIAEDNVTNLQGRMSTAEANIALKQNIITTGTTAQYLRGNLSLATFPTDLSSFANSPGYITSAALSGYATVTAVTAKPDVYSGTTKQTSPKMYAASFTITSAGTAVFNLTNDGTAGGTALMTLPNVASTNVWINDATSQYQASAALSNGNKTLTVTLNKAGFLNVALLGLTILATPVAAPVGTVVNVQIWGQ